MDPLEKMQPRLFKQRFFASFDTPEIPRRQNTAVAAARPHSLNEFKKAWEIYPNDAGADRKTDAPAHHSDEFPSGYSLAGRSPAARLRFTSHPQPGGRSTQLWGHFFRKDCFEN